MRLIDYIKYRLDKAVDMCRNNTSLKDDIALYLRDLEKDLYGKEKVVIDGKVKSETQADEIVYNAPDKTSDI